MIAIQVMGKNAVRVVEDSLQSDIMLIEQSLEQVESVAYGVSQNDSLMPFIEAGIDTSFTFVELQNFKKILVSYGLNNPLIHDILLQNNINFRAVDFYTVYSNQLGFYNTKITSPQANNISLSNNSLTARDYNANGVCIFTDGQHPAIPFFLQLPLRKENTATATVYANSDILLAPILNLVANSGGAVQIYNAQNNILIEKGELTHVINKLEKLELNNKRRLINGKGYRVFNLTGYGSKWKYVILLPESYVLGDVQLNRLFLIIFNFISLFAGLYICFKIASRKSHSFSQLLGVLGTNVKKIDIKTDEFKHLYPHISKLQSENTSILHCGSQNILKILLNGEFDNPADIEKDLKKYKIELSGSCYGVFILYHENMHYSDCFTDNFRSFLFSEIHSIAPDAQSYFADRKTTVLILSFNGDENTYYENVKHYIWTMNHDVFLKYNVPIIFGVSPPVYSLKEIHAAYLNALDTVDYNRLISSCKQWFYRDLPDETDNWYYPIELERTLFDSVIHFNFENARTVLNKIKTENFEKRNLSVKNIKELLGELKASIKKISSLQSDEFEFMQSNISVDQFFEYTVGYFHKLCSNYNKNISTRGDKICSQIKDYIDKHYDDADLSLNYLAERYSMNSSYLSTLFKKNIGYGFFAYLEKVRIEESVKLLSTGEYNIRDIAKMVGFVNEQTFRRSFKKVKGINPSDFTKY